jgi:rRNA maturation RNase YbeY
MQQIFFYSFDRPVDLKRRTSIKNLIVRIFTSEKIALNKVTFILCSDKHLLKLNRKYLNHNFYTDVISFLLSSKSEPVFGEVYLSSDRIKENAKKYGVSYQNELLRVIIHGALHLSGFEDQTKAQRKIMREKENFYLSLFKISFT